MPRSVEDPPGDDLPEVEPATEGPLVKLRRLRGTLQELLADSSGDMAESLDDVVEEVDGLLRRMESSERVAVEQGAVKALRQLLRIEQRKYRELSEFTPEAVLLTDVRGVIREANRKAGELFGTDPTDLEGRRLDEFVPAKSREEFRRRIEGIRQSAGRVEFGLTLTREARGAVPVDVTAEEVGASSDRRAQGIRWGLSDATARRRTERIENVLRQFGEERAEAERTSRRRGLLAEVSRLLASSPLRHREALDEAAELVVQRGHADHCVVWLRRDGEIEQVGTALTDAPTARVPARFRADYGLGGSAASGTMERILADGGTWLACESPVGEPDGARSLRRRDDAFGVCRGAVVPLTTRGSSFGAVGFFDLNLGPGYEDDVTFARELAERMALGVENARLFEEARRALRERDTLRRMASHDLRNCLTNLTLALDDLRRGIPQEAEGLVRDLDQAETSVDRMIALVDGLDPSGSAEASDRLRLQPVDLGALARDVRDAYRGVAEANDIELDVDVHEKVPTVSADPQRIRQVLDNLVRNSVEFTPPGGRVVVRVAPRDDRAEVSVLDTGPGLPEEDPEKVFDRFWRGDGTSRIEGSGLGLAVAEAVVRAHRGRIRARNRDEGGAALSFVLPPEPGASEPETSPGDGSPPGTAA